MVTFDSDPLDGPRVSTTDVSGSAMRVVKYVVGVGMLFVFLGIAQNTVAPAIGGVFENVLGVNTGADTGPLTLGEP